MVGIQPKMEQGLKERRMNWPSGHWKQKIKCNFANMRWTWAKTIRLDRNLNLCYMWPLT